MVGKSFGKEETPKAQLRQLVTGLVFAIPGTPLTFWYSLPIIEIIDWAHEVEKWLPKKNTRQS
jgi:hypothetical protein